MLKLFYAVGSCSQASHIALAEAGAAYELVRTETARGDQRKPEYLAVNPKGRVPALITDQGVLTETPAILAYIAAAYPEARLAPADPWAFAQMQAFNAYLCSTVHVAHAHKHRGYRWANEESSFADMRSKVAANETECFNLIEAELLRGPWVMGDQYTVADGYLYTLTGWLEGDGVDARRFPKVFEHFQRMAERPAVRKVIAEEGS